jgi:hypothetical protein
MLKQTTRAHASSKQESRSSTTLRRLATRVVRQFGHRQAVTDHLTLMAIERVARVQHERLSCRCDIQAQYSKTQYDVSGRGRTISMAAAVLLRCDAATLFVAMTRLPAWIVRVGCLLGQKMRHGEA